MVDVLDLKHPPTPPAPEPIEEVAVDVPVEFPATPESVSWGVEHVATLSRSRRELMFLGSMAVAGAAIAWWQASWLTFIMVLMGLAAWEVHSRLGSSHRVEIDRRGILVGSYRHRYEHLHSYDIHTMPDQTVHLSIRTTRWHVPQLHIPLGDQNAQDIHAVLSQYLIQEDHKIPFVTYFLRKP